MRHSYHSDSLQPVHLLYATHALFFKTLAKLTGHALFSPQIDAHMSETERERFERAAEFMRTASGLRLANEQKLQLYGYFKQVAASPRLYHVVQLCASSLTPSGQGGKVLHG